MDVLNKIRDKAKSQKKTIVFPESNDPRTIEAVNTLALHQIVKPILIGDENELYKQLEKNNQVLESGIRIISPEKSEQIHNFANELYNKRKSKGLTFEEARETVQNPLYFAAMMVKNDLADGCVAGAVNTTADVLRAGIQVIGVKKGISVVSSIFLMILPDGRALTYGDCGVVPYPDAEQLGSIAVASAESHFQLTGESPKIAFLSFSTKGSAQHSSVDKVQQAVHWVKKNYPDLVVDGELQFDAALVPSVGVRKAPGSPVAGYANVFIFPNLDAGNIGYKITERLAGAQALGPIIQGLAKPMNDLSRGCNAEDIVNVAAICAVKSE